MTQKQRTIALCMPSYGIMDSEAAVTMAIQYAEMVMYWKGLHGPDARVAICTMGRAFAPDARNSITKMALSIGAEWLFWVDDDMILPPNTFRQLMSRDLPIVSGLYQMKREGDGDSQLVFFNEDGRWSRLTVKAPSGLMKCHGTGFGCILISGELMKRVYDKTNGVPFVAYPGKTEDLYFFDHVKEMGVQFYLDSTLICGHVGRKVYTCSTVSIDEFNANIGKPVIQDRVDKAAGTIVRAEPAMTPIPIPTNIRGWMFTNELVYLYGTARSCVERTGVKAILEIGSYEGLSSAALAQAGDLTCVDTWQGGQDGIPEGDSLPTFEANMKALGVDQNIEAIVGSSRDVLPSLKAAGRQYAFIFIDGAHDYETVRADIEDAIAMLVPGGVLVIDDTRDYDGVVKAAVDVGGFEPIEDTKMSIYRPNLKPVTSAQS